MIQAHAGKIVYYTSRNTGKTIIFIHGLSGSSTAWKDYARHFTGYNIIAVDLRGHGLSLRPEKDSDFAINKFSEDIYQVLRQEKISKCIMVSHSFGTLVALDFLKRHQRMVEKAVLISPGYAPSKQSKYIKRLIEMGTIMNYLPTLKKKGGHIDYRKYMKTGDWNVRRMYVDITNTGVKSYLIALHHAFMYDASRFLPKIHIPVLLIHGEKDTIFPVQNAQHMAKVIPNAKIVIMPKANHLIVLNHAKEVMRTIDAFL